MTLPNHPEKIVRDAKDLAQQELATNVYFLVVESPEIARKAKAGQFVQLRILSGDFTLRRPVGVAAVDEKKAQELAEKLKKNRFTLTDYLDQLNSMKNMGSLQDLAGMILGLDAKALAGAKIDEKAMAHTEAIILSMTPAERENPSILNSSRKRRIAAGAGVGVVDINRLLKQFEMMQTMARQFSGKKMKRFQRGGGKMPFGF